jgi:hypothetical protein
VRRSTTARFFKIRTKELPTKSAVIFHRSNQAVGEELTLLGADVSFLGFVICLL